MSRLRGAAWPAAVPGVPSRRDLLRGLASAGLALGIVGRADPGAAKKRRKKRKHTKKVRKNQFGCVDVGKGCENAGQCCSGICTGKKGKKRCQAHDQSTCQAGQHVCVDDPTVLCTTTAGDEGQCATTTGNAGYCVLRGDCFPCRRDADCELFYGAGAACIVCAPCGLTGGTSCVGIEPL